MSAKPNTARVVLLTLLGVTVAAVLTGWWLATHKRVEEIIDLPRTGEARRNPLYALKVALEKDEVTVTARRRLQLLPLGGAGSAPLAARDTVLLYNDPRTLTAQETDALLQWVGRGGHLVVRTPPHGFLARNAPAPLLGALGLSPLGAERGGCEHVHLRVSEPAPDGDDDGDVHGGMLFCGSRRFNLAGANPVHAWGNLKDGYVYARVRRGAGSVDVLADLDFLATDELKGKASVELARQLLQPNHRAGTVHLIYAAQVPSLWTTLVRHSWMAWGPLLLALLLWLWQRMQRFGPLLPAPAGERRSLLEHVVASGEHVYRYGYAHLLYAAVRNAFLARLRRRDPQAAALQGEPQLMLLGERFGDIPRAQIRDALMPPFAHDHAAFRSRIATLIRLRNRL